MNNLDLEMFVASLDRSSFSYKEITGQKEVGSWTPASTTVTLTVTSATWEKIGNVVVAQFDVTWPSTADGSAAQITGLPFTASGVNHGVAIMSTTRATFISALVPASTNRIDLYANGTLTNANVSTERFIGTATYLL